MFADTFNQSVSQSVNQSIKLTRIPLLEEEEIPGIYVEVLQLDALLHASSARFEDILDCVLYNIIENMK